MRDVDAYLHRISYGGATSVSIETLAALQLAHLRTVPFEALDVFNRVPVHADDEWAWSKIVDRHRGGWCFEANGAFALLLEGLGFQVRRLGAAVLLRGPAVLVDHLVLEVQLDQAWLVEVGFGDQAPITPLPLADQGPIDTPSGTFEFIPSPQGTTLAEHVDGTPQARYRFKRVAHSLNDFSAASTRLQTDRSLFWSTSPFATRLADDDGTRVTLTRSTLTTTRHGEEHREPVAADQWLEVLRDQFGIDIDVDIARLAPDEDGAAE